MACVRCDERATSDPQHSLGWRCIELDRRDRHYVCAMCLPPAGAPQKVWADFYVETFKVIVERTPNYRPANDVIFWREVGDGMPPVSERLM